MGGVGRWRPGDIYLWDGVTYHRCSRTSGVQEHHPGISGSKVAWERGGGASEIYFWDGATTTQITNNTTSDFAPRISGSKVVWYGGPGPYEGEIYLWDGVTVTNISNNGRENSSPRISGSNVMWYGCDADSGPLCTGGGDYEIYLWGRRDHHADHEQQQGRHVPRHLRLERGVERLRRWNR